MATPQVQHLEKKTEVYRFELPKWLDKADFHGSPKVLFVCSNWEFKKTKRRIEHVQQYRTYLWRTCLNIKVFSDLKSLSSQNVCDDFRRKSMTLPAKFVAFGRPARARQTVKSHLDQLAEIWGKSVRYSGFVYMISVCVYYI